MKQHKFDVKLYLRVEIGSGETLTVSTKSSTLFALPSQLICVKLFKNNQGETMKASLAVPKYCNESL